LIKNGFEIFTLGEMSFVDQINLFNNASQIIGLHGAGFANLIFCRPQTNVLELKPITAGPVCGNLAKNNNLNYNIAKKVATEGLPKLLKLYSKYEIRATFYFTGTFAKYFPEAVLEVLRQGSEVGCHGYSHLYSHAFDVMPIDQQYSHLLNAKKILEDIAGKIVSFRAPALRLNSNTVKILKHLDFNTDSSVAPQRFDGPLTSGSLNKLSWILSKRKPYFVGETLYKEGNSNLLEIPVSSFVFGYQGTTLRFSPNLNSIVESFLLSESKKNSK